MSKDKYKKKDITIFKTFPTISDEWHKDISDEKIRILGDKILESMRNESPIDRVNTFQSSLEKMLKEEKSELLRRQIIYKLNNLKLRKDLIINSYLDFRLFSYLYFSDISDYEVIKNNDNFNTWLKETEEKLKSCNYYTYKKKRYDEYTGKFKIRKPESMNKEYEEKK